MNTNSNKKAAEDRYEIQALFDYGKSVYDTERVKTRPEADNWAEAYYLQPQVHQVDIIDLVSGKCIAVKHKPYSQR